MSLLAILLEQLSLRTILRTAIISAFDGMLHAEKEAAVTGPLTGSTKLWLMVLPCRQAS